MSARRPASPGRAWQPATSGLHNDWVIAALLAFAVACAHAAAPAPQRTQPDVEAINEARDAQECRPGESSSACGSDSFVPVPYVSARAYSHLLAALVAMQTENQTVAIAELHEALLYDPESPHLHTLLADAFVHLGRIGDADEALKAALQADPQHAPAQVMAGRIAAARGHFAEARGHLRAAIAAAPESPEAWRELVHLDVTQGDLDDAQKAAAELEQVVHGLNARSQAAEKQEALAQERPGVAEPDPLGELLAASIRLREDSGRAWEEVARGFIDKRDDAGAEAAYARAEAIDPGGLEQIASHAQFLETRRRFSEARDEELKMLARRPESPEVLSALSRLALEAGDAETSEGHLAKLIELAAELDPEPAPGSDVSESAERGDERRELAAALLRAGLPLLGARRPGAAAPAFDAAARLLPAHPEPLFYRALSLENRGRAKEAAALLDKVVGAMESRPITSLLGVEPAALLMDARVQAALAKGRAGEMAASLKELHAIFARSPLDEGAALGLLEGFDRAGKASETLPLYEAALAEHPGDATLLFALASAQDRAGKNEAAVQTMRRLLQRAPDHPGALNYVGYSLVEKGGAENLAEGKRLLERAVELRPDDGAIADSYGLCLLKLGQPREALLELKRADALTPGDPVVLGHLGDAQLAMGDKASAEETFRRALDRLEPAPRAAARHPRSAARSLPSSPAAPASPPALDEPLEERVPEPGDAKVKAELLEKLRALTNR